MRQSPHLARRRRLVSNFQARAGRVAFLRAGQHVARDAVDERGLADPLGTRDEPGMVHAPAGEGPRQLVLRPGMADQCARLARMRETLEPVGLRQRLALRQGWRARHHVAPGRRRCSTSTQIAAATLSAVLAPSISTQRCGSARAIAA